jgi:hypothetical protein
MRELKKTTGIACMKCGGTDILTRYHKSGKDCWDGCCCEYCLPGELKGIEEHLHRTCRTCQYDWRDPCNKALGATKP